MKRRVLLPALALCLLLTGCGWLDGSYVSVRAHREQHQENKTEALVASNYRDLMRVLEDLIADGSETGLITIAGYPEEAVDSGMDTAIRYATERYPIGSYAVSDIAYELGTNNGLPALAVEITYRHSAAQIRAIRTVADMDRAWEVVTQALENYDSQVVLRISNYFSKDFAQMVRTYGEENPNLVMEIPQVTASVYGMGLEKVVELSFAYQNSREDLRKMQTQVRPVFDSAVLYVSGDGKDNQKLSQLYAFLMERFPYQLETSITPAYSLLRHGVGDSRAFALVYAAMCREAGLECLTVTGTCAGEPRTWNIVKDDGRYYHLDLLSCYASGGFRERTDEQMSGYVWDYSAYPACPPEPAAAQPQDSEKRAPQPTKPTDPAETQPDGVQPGETQPETLPAESTAPGETQPDATETTEEEKSEVF